MNMRKVSAEKFETWYPKEPENVLRNFLLSGKKVMNVVFKSKNKNVVVASISPEHAERILEEFRIMREGTLNEQD